MKIIYLTFALFLATNLVAQQTILFENKQVNLGEIYEGELPEVNYIYKNAGLDSLYIYKVKSSCGCYSPTWKSQPVASKKQDTIKAYYNTVAHLGGFTKSLFVETSAEKKDIELQILGTVKPFLPNTQFYLGTLDKTLFFNVIDLPLGEKKIEITFKKDFELNKEMVLVLATHSLESIPVMIQNSDFKKDLVGFRILEQGANNEMNFLKLNSFFAKEGISHLLYLKPTQRTNTFFSITLNHKKVPIHLIFE